MLIEPNFREEPNRSHNRSLKKSWDDSDRYAPLIGCIVCQYRFDCGGLHKSPGAFDCLSYCCNHPENCDVVCFKKPMELAKRIREVRGFSLKNVPLGKPLPAPDLPRVVPIVYHGSSREKAFAPMVVCLPFDKVIGYNGKVRYANAEEIAKAFKIRRGTPIIITGTCKDAPLEKWWGINPNYKIETILRLRDLGVILVTTPNFSLFTDHPRLDNLHSMKRIALTHEEFQRNGLLAALHVNARTDQDWKRWTEYVRKRDEVTHIAYEFGTGTGQVERIMRHANNLAKLAKNAGRPLHAVIRSANVNVLPILIPAFSQITVLDTEAFMRAVNRRRAVKTASGKLAWEESPTPSGAPIDGLLEHNWSLREAELQSATAP